jgi:pyridoxal 5-phosphate dependent beta-lyase
MAAHGFARRPLPTDADGRVVVEEAAISLAADPPELVHLTVVASHRGVVQPLQQLARLCNDLGLPLIVDAAQGLGQVDCSVGGVDAVYASSRKWMAGPRGVGVLAVRPALLRRLRPRLPPPEWVSSLSVAQRLELGEANIAARVGFSVAIGEHIACGPAAVQARLREVGLASRTVLAEVPRWRVVEAADEPSALTTLAPLDGADPQKIRVWLIAERGIVTTSAGIERAPLELTGPVLRISPHVDTTIDDLTTFAAALTEATVAV